MKQAIKNGLKSILRYPFALMRLLLHGRVRSGVLDDMPNDANVDKNVELPNDRFLPEVRRVIEEGHTATIRVKGFSMRPFLEHCRDKVILERVQSLHVGDAALAEVSKGRFVLHRVIRIDGTHVTLMGDGNLYGTEECELNNVAGVVKTFIRNGKPVSAQSRRWKLYSRIWPRLKPVRRYLLFIYRGLL